MVKITEKQCHISLGISDASFCRALTENYQADSRIRQMCIMTPQL